MTMEDDFTRRADVDLDRVDARTTERVDRMSEKERVELARELARRRKAVAAPAPPPTKPAKVRDAPVRPSAPKVAAPDEVAQIEAELRTTERRLARLERLPSSARFGGGSEPSTRYLRALTRAEHLERKLRGLR